jgi:hypothetical protein
MEQCFTNDANIESAALTNKSPYKRSKNQISLDNPGPSPLIPGLNCSPNIFQQNENISSQSPIEVHGSQSDIDSLLSLNVVQQGKIMINNYAVSDILLLTTILSNIITTPFAANVGNYRFNIDFNHVNTCLRKPSDEIFIIDLKSIIQINPNFTFKGPILLYPEFYPEMNNLVKSHFNNLIKDLLPERSYQMQFKFDIEVICKISFI